VPPRRIHHLNFVVRDLGEAATRLERVLDLEPFEFIDYPARDATVARTRVGETWLVLVCPGNDESPPGQYLARHGEGLFLISFGVEDVPQELGRLSQDGFMTTDDGPRDGIVDWSVADIGELHGAIVQLARDDD
jgi:methylmalonyl-CoA/ethylmalonyl-CoA epimerase